MGNNSASRGAGRFAKHQPCACGHSKIEHRGATHIGACEECDGCRRYQRASSARQREFMRDQAKAAMPMHIIDSDGQPLDRIAFITPPPTRGP